MAAGNQVFIGVDIGGTKIGVNGIDGARKPLSGEWTEVPSNSHIGPGATVQQIVVGLKTFLSRMGMTMDQVSGLGVDSPGPADINGRIERSANMHPDWEGFQLRDRTEDAIVKEVGRSVPVVYENDCNAAGLWESFVGDPSGKEVMFLLAPGTGLGGGIVINGRLLRGA
ncbi:MAG TPA: ROK family protein, partial [Tepidisphaeraceae bacterium]|nr:ROK family protein [Tepidisphaeraceae bacterium]